MRGFLTRFRPFRGRVLLALGLSIVEAMLLLPIPILIGRSIDRALPEGDERQMVLIGVAMAVLALVSAGAHITARAIDLRVSMEVTRRLRHDLYARLLELPKSAYDKTPITDFHDTIVQDALRVQVLTSVVVTTMMPTAILTVGISIILLSLNWQLALLTIAFVPALFVTGRRVNARIRLAADEFHPAFRDFSARSLLMLRSQSLIRLAGAEKHELEVADQQLDHLRETNVRVAFLSAANPAVQQAVIAVAGAALLVGGGLAVIRADMSLGELLSFYAGFAVLRGPAGSFAQSFTSIVQGRQALGRVAALLDSPRHRPYTGDTPLDLVGHLEVRDAVFGYGTERPVLHNVSLVLEPGTIVALVGPNGSGKSTLVNLLLGFYRPQSGGVWADGVAYDQLDMRQLRPQLGVVTQEPFLLPASVLENVVYGKEYSPDDLERALRLSGADLVVETLPDGLDTHIGDDGIRLSGGQRQRIAIARALLGGPRVLIFDEPTNHLDSAAVSTLIANLRSLGDEVSVLIVSHRNEVLQDADLTIAFDEGEIAWQRRSATTTRTPEPASVTGRADTTDEVRPAEDER